MGPTRLGPAQSNLRLGLKIVILSVFLALKSSHRFLGVEIVANICLLVTVW